MPPSNVSWLIVVAAGIAIAIALLTASVLVSRKHRARTERPRWPQLIDDGLTACDAPQRRQLIERLDLLDTQWSRYVIEAAREEETDPRVRQAIDCARLLPRTRR